MPAVGEALAELAEAALEAGLAIAREEHGPGHEQCRLAIIGMGKTGGGELNYVSDVDVIFVAEPADGVDEDTALRVGTALATATMRACSTPTSEGSPARRPRAAARGQERPAGAHHQQPQGLLRALGQDVGVQALLKARVSAGDKEIGLRYKAEISPMVGRRGP